MSETEKLQERLQENLLLIRRAVGWTAEELGDRIGVTRQTINNLEAKRNKLKKTLYIAIRAVLDAEIKESPEDTEMLQCILEVFVDNPERYNEKDKETLLAKANMLTPSILAGTSTRAEVSKEFVEVAKTFGLLAISATFPAVAAGVVARTSLRLSKARKHK